MVLVDLASHSNGRPVALADISQRQEISLSYLEQLFAKLRRNGLVKSVRGPGGGYLLARDPGDIYLGQVVRMFDGPLAPVPCASQTAYVPCADCPNEAICGVHLAMKAVRDATAKVLDGTSLASLQGQVEQASTLAATH